jgi:hypothetical protein
MGLGMNIISAISGIYIGIYLDQNYKLPSVPPPEHVVATVTSRVKHFFETNKKDDDR